MSVMAEAAGREKGAAPLRKSRIKPEIYTTADGKTVVEDELLNFLVVKMKTLSQDDIVLLTVNHFGSEWIENSRKVLFELCPHTTQRFVTHKGHQKDVNNVKSCLKVLNEAGENIPCFVSYHMDELPPVTFNSLDVSCLLGKIDRLGVDLSTMKQALSAQTDVCEDLRGVVAGLNQRLCLMEKGEEDAKSLLSPEVAEEEVAGQVLDNTGQEPGTTTVLNTNAAEEGSGYRGAETASPKWSRVVKHGRRQHSHGDAFIQSKPRMNAPRRDKKSGIVGTSAGGSIQVVKTKLVSVFATKFSPDVNSEALASYLKDNLHRDVTCEKIDSAQRRYNSFKVTAECNNVGEMYEPQLWPEGVFVRRFYEACKPVDIKTRSVAKTGCVSDAGATVAVKPGLSSS